VVLEDTGRNPFNTAADSTFAINFPAMPDQIELVRRAEYKVSANMVLPDGIHQYMSTAPLEIPFSFKIHHGDTEYCTEGPLTLLNLAARLHALVLPLGDSSFAVQVNNDASLDEGGNSQSGLVGLKNDAAVNQNSGQAASAQGSNSTQASYNKDETRKTDPPVTVRLELIRTRIEGTGIMCIGYIKDVKVVLLGPWLRGPDEAFNLPSAGDYSFTFVHRPGHGNWFSNRAGTISSLQAQAYAKFVRDRLYNTRDLAKSGKYRGFDTPTG
jgi:hypothetical protein